MSLEDQIAQIVEPLLFARLCNTVFAAEYGHDYQVIDGTRGDEGNDGWVRSERRILAVHCPLKPERKTDAGLREKAFSDLEKARGLRDSGRIQVDRWTFVTPRKLSNSLVVDIARRGDELGIAANHIEATHLAVSFLKHPELTKEFAELHVSQLEELLRQAIEWSPPALEGANQRAGDRPPEDDIHHFLDVKAAAAEDGELKEVVALRQSSDEGAAKAGLRTFFYRSSDPTVQLNAVLGLVDLFAPADDDANDLANLCESAIGAARRVGSRSAEAYLLAQQGYLLSFEFGRADLARRANVLAEAQIGFSLSDPQETKAANDQIQRLGEKFTGAFKSALHLAKDSRSPLAMAAVLICIGNAAGQRALYLRQLGTRADADAERDACKRALLCARDLYAEMGRELDVVDVQFNLANQIRFLGEEQTAKQLVDGIIPVAKKYGYDDLLRKATWLKESLETGIIPDYMAGERRKG